MCMWLVLFFFFIPCKKLCHLDYLQQGTLLWQEPRVLFQQQGRGKMGGRRRWSAAPARRGRLARLEVQLQREARAEPPELTACDASDRGGEGSHVTVSYLITFASFSTMRFPPVQGQKRSTEAVKHRNKTSVDRFQSEVLGCWDAQALQRAC